MAYDRANPPRLHHETPGGSGWRQFDYRNTDTVATVRAAGYITNARQLGMRVGDRLTYIKTDDNTQQEMIVVAIATNGSADLSDGTAISATNT